MLEVTTLMFNQESDNGGPEPQGGIEFSRPVTVQFRQHLVDDSV